MADEARLLEKRGYIPEIHINYLPELEDWFHALREEGLLVSRFDPPPFIENWRWRRLNKLRAQVLSTGYLRRRRADLAHIFLSWTTEGMSRLWLMHRCEIPCVISVHNSFPSYTAAPWTSRLLGEAFASVRGVYAVSGSARRAFEAVYGRYLRPRTRFEIINNFVDTDRFVPSVERRARARKAFGIPQDALLLGSVGRLESIKRPDLIISVFANLRKRFPSLYLILVGRGPMERELRQLVAEADLEGHMIFAGFQSEVEKIFPALDLHLLVSEFEGLPLVLLEAMACGVPAVGTEVPGTVDVLRGSRGGILVPRDDEAEIVAAVRRLLEDVMLRNEMAREARLEAEQRFTKPLWENPVAAFYEAVLG